MNHKIQKTPKSELKLALCCFIVALTWLIIFGVTIAQTNSTACIGVMWYNSQKAFQLYIGITIAQIFLVVLKIYQYCKDKTTLSNGFSCLNSLVQLAQTGLGLTAFIMLCIAYASHAQCPDLEKFILGYIIIQSVLIGLICVIPILLIPCLIGILMKGKQINSQKNHESLKNNSVFDHVPQVDLVPQANSIPQTDTMEQINLQNDGKPTIS